MARRKRKRKRSRRQRRIGRQRRRGGREVARMRRRTARTRGKGSEGLSGEEEKGDSDWDGDLIEAASKRSFPPVGLPPEDTKPEAYRVR